jgi:hypothetical protein
MFGGIDLDISERHLCAFVGESRRDRPSDTLGGAGYDCDFASQAGHGSSSTRELYFNLRSSRRR